MYRRVFEALAAEIKSGKYKPGQRFPSEAALVTQFRTSRITVGRALAELVRRGMVERVAGSGTFVRPGRSPRATFGLLIPNLGRAEIFDPICRGIAAAPQAADFALLWGHAGAHSTPGSEASEAVEICDQFIAREVSGVFFAPLEDCHDAAAINAGIARQARPRAHSRRAARPLLYALPGAQQL